jgi:thiol reductant ABC exporter CydC subunit
MTAPPVVRLLALARPAAAGLAGAALSGAAAAASGIGLIAAAAWLISRAATHPPILHLTVAIVAVRAFGIARGPLRYLERLAGHDAALRVMTDLRAAGYARLERLAPAGLRGARAGDLLSRFVADVDAAVDVLTRVVLPYLTVGLAGAAAVALLAALLPAAGMALLVGLLVVFVLGPAVHSALGRRVQRRTADLRGQLAAQTVDLLHGLPDLLAYGAADDHLARAARTDADLRRVATRTSASVGVGAALVALAAGACVWSILVLASPAVRSGHLDGVLLAVVVLTPLAVFDVASAVPAAATHLGSARAALGRLFALADAPDPTPGPARPVALPAGPYHLRVEHVTARWHPDGEDVLRDVTLDLPPGAHVTLSQPSGWGKSTLAALLVRFLDPVKGRVTLNGVDLRRLAGDDLRRVVGLVADDAHVFDTTIEENLRIGRPDATQGQLRTALAAARLLSFVESLPDGLATEVGERGVRLSGGQRRRLALARALVADYPVLILDEPTEHLDDETAEAITEDLLSASAGRTLLLISHRGPALPSSGTDCSPRRRPSPRRAPVG